MFFETCETCGKPVVPRYCPACGTLIDGHTEVHLEDVCPAPGDVSVCVYCCAVSVFTETSLRTPDLKELDEILADPEMQKAIYAVQELWRQRGGAPRGDR